MLSLCRCSACGDVFGDVGDEVTLAGHAGGAIGESGSGGRIDAGRAVNEVSVKACGFDLLVS